MSKTVIIDLPAGTFGSPVLENALQSMASLYHENQALRNQLQCAKSIARKAVAMPTVLLSQVLGELEGEDWQHWENEAVAHANARHIESVLLWNAWRMLNSAQIDYSAIWGDLF